MHWFWQDKHVRKYLGDVMHSACIGLEIRGLWQHKRVRKYFGDVPYSPCTGLEIRGLWQDKRVRKYLGDVMHSPCVGFHVSSELVGKSDITDPHAAGSFLYRATSTPWTVQD